MLHILAVLFLARSLAGFSELAPDPLALVANAFALVRLRRSNVANLGRHLPDALLVRSADRNLVGSFDGDADPLRRLDDDRMREPELQRQLLALHLRAVADAHDFEVARVALGHAVDHVGDQRAGESVQLARALLVVGPRDRHGLAVDGDRDRRGNGEVELAFRSFYPDRAVVDLHVDARGDRHGHASDSAHAPLPTTRMP